MPLFEVTYIFSGGRRLTEKVSHDSRESLERFIVSEKEHRKLVLHDEKGNPVDTPVEGWIAYDIKSG